MGAENLDAIDRTEREIFHIASLASVQDDSLSGIIITMVRDRFTGQLFVGFPEINVGKKDNFSIPPFQLRELNQPLEGAIENFEAKFPWSPLYCNNLVAGEIVNLNNTEVWYEDDKQLLLLRPYGVLYIITPEADDKEPA